MEENIIDGHFKLANYTPLVLAYMGDAVMELLVRKYIIGDGNTTTSKLNEKAKLFVTAESQSAAVEILLPFFSEFETMVYKLGRNSKSPHSPKSASAVAYRKATGLECVFGYLFLSGNFRRAQELFGLICAKTNIN